MSEFDLGDWLSEVPAAKEMEPPTLTNLEVKVLNYTEQVFWETGLVPTVEKIAEDLELNHLRVRKAFSNEMLIQQLAARGISLDEKLNKALSPKQILVANMMLNLHDKRSEREKLELCQVSSQQYHAWLRQPQFVEFIRRRGEALFKSTDAAAYAALVKNVKAGDNASLKLFFEMRGIFTPKLDINVNIEAILTRVIDVVSQRIQDPALLQLIAGDLEAIGEEVG